MSRSGLVAKKQDGILGAMGAMNSNIRSIFGRMDIAEQEIASAKRRHRKADKEGAFSKAFTLVMPNSSFAQKADDVYRAHAREMLERLAAGDKNIDRATKAEVLIALLELATRAPPGPIYATLTERLFNEIFPDKPIAGEAPREPWPGACDDLFSTMAKKLARARVEP